MMGAGLASSTAYNSNVNLVSIGNKLQGLVPTATQHYIPSGRGGWNNYLTRGYAPRRDFIFSMNQLGGVGRAMSPYKIDGVNNPDAPRRFAPYRYVRR